MKPDRKTRKTQTIMCKVYKRIQHSSSMAERQADDTLPVRQGRDHAGGIGSLGQRDRDRAQLRAFS